MIIQFLISYLLCHTPIYGGSLKDLAYYRNDETAISILEDITASPRKYLPGDVFLLSGFPDHKHQDNTVFNIELENNVLNISYLKNKLFYIRQFDLDTDEYTDYSMSGINWTLTISLVNRKIILTSDLYGIKKVYPIGASAFDLGVSHVNIDELMTPRLSSAYLDPKRAVYASKAHGYNDLPFLPLTKNNGEITWYALHSVQNAWSDILSKNKPNFNFLYRGFLSHGCIRVRMRDLYELYYIVTQSKKITVNINYISDDMLESSYPYWNDTYNKVSNFGSTRNPIIHNDPAGYYHVQPEVGPPPIELLK